VIQAKNVFVAVASAILERSKLSHCECPLPLDATSVTSVKSGEPAVVSKISAVAGRVL
jgi:hypothetical protein